MKLWAPLLLAVALAIGCETNFNFRSADFSGEKLYQKHASTGPQLRDSEVLGLARSDSITDEEINRVLDSTSSLKVKPGSAVLLVQSGASHPDKEMINELSRHFTVIPHSGIPSEIAADPDSRAKSLRLAAAQSKAETILVYWGNLEIKRDELLTGIVSWVPVLDFTVPDEYQKMRMHLKVALIDVRTGSWATFRTEPIEAEGLTTRYARERDQKRPLQNVKQRLYENSVRKLVDSYTLASAR